MKKNSLILAGLFCLLSLFGLAQAPNAIPYQAVARNAAGNIIASQAIALRISILDANDGVVYSERQTATTSTLGQFNFNIGQGTTLSGIFAGINWGSGAKSVQVELDATGGTNYTDMGTTQLNSVPYALYAGSSGDWTKSGSNIYNSNTGNVGIGTNAPTSKLTIVKALGNSLELLSGSNDDWTSLAIGRATEEMNFGVATAPDNFMNGTQEGDAVIRLNDATKKIVISPWVDNPTMVVTGTSVGIGTTAPTAKFHTQLANGKFRLFDNPTYVGTALLGEFAGNAGNAPQIRLATDGSPNVIDMGLDAAGNFVIEGNDVSRMVVTNSGNVGIGTTVPTAKLDVSGTVKISDGTQGTGKILTSDANGLASWQPSLTTHTIGESYGGGTVFYVYDNGQHGLIAAANDVNGGLNIRWYAGTNTNTMAFGDGIGAGASNTAIIVANQGNGDGAPYAARLCQAYSVTVGGVTYGDWYLPSKSELDLLLHQQGIVGNIQSYGYWSSTEGSTAGAWRQDRNNYIQYQTNKTGPTDGSSVRARPIRRF